MTDEQRAALKIQALARGKSGRVRYEHIRDEEACRQWVAYYVAVGEYADAEELGWDGENPPPPTAEDTEERQLTQQRQEQMDDERNPKRNGPGWHAPPKEGAPCCRPPVLGGAGAGVRSWLLLARARSLRRSLLFRLPIPRL